MSAAIAEALSLEALVKAQAYGLGFDLVGITVLGPVETADAFDAWIERGYSGDMDYLPRGAAKRRDSRLPVSNATSAIVVGLSYGGAEPSGPVARYARGDDYHEVMTARLEELHRWLESETGRWIRGKAYVDTGPILERDLARRAGLGWFGKNTNLINPRIGSFFFIGVLLLDLDLVADEPFEADRCGSCTRCLDACPTDAFVDARVLDATKCISYLTIEAKGAIPPVLREFKESFPEHAISINPGDTADMVALTLNQRVDLALTLEPEKEAQLEFHPLFTDELQFIVGADHPWAKAGCVERAEIPRANYILYNKRSVTFRLITEFFRREDIVLNTVIELGSMEATKELVKLGLGVSILAPWIARKELAEGSLVSLPLGRRKLKRRWVILKWQGKKLNLAEETFIGLCESAAGLLQTQPGSDLVMQG